MVYPNTEQRKTHIKIEKGNNMCYLNLCMVVNIWRIMCRKQVQRVATSNYISQILWDVITCPCPWYLLLTNTSSYIYVSLEWFKSEFRIKCHSLATDIWKRTFYHSVFGTEWLHKQMQFCNKQYSMNPYHIRIEPVPFAIAVQHIQFNTEWAWYGGHYEMHFLEGELLYFDSKFNQNGAINNESSFGSGNSLAHNRRQLIHRCRVTHICN